MPATKYDQTIQELYRLLPAYQRIGARAFKKDLSNIRALCRFLDYPETKFPTIHIAGTNGKGSVANMLSSIFQEAGYTTALYTSPHISDFRERIQVNGTPIHKNSVIAFTKRIKPLILDIKPSFFEVTVAMAFDHFHRAKVDMAIIETGLGGRLDSTNIIRPKISIITNIGLEHQAMLGDTLKLIAAEKAGIIKEATPVVIGKTQKETRPVFNRIAKEAGAPVIYADQEYQPVSSSVSRRLRKVVVRNTRDRELTYHLDLPAEYQVENSITVLTAVDLVNEQKTFSISKAALKRGFRSATKNNLFKGRWQVIGNRPMIVADGSHNADGIKSIVRQLRSERFDKLHIIYGCVADKDLGPILKNLPRGANYYLTQPDVERALPVGNLVPKFIASKMTVRFSDRDPNACLQQARKEAAPNDLIMICGSIFLLSSFL